MRQDSVVVLDSGGCTCKVGFAGRTHPQYVWRSRVAPVRKADRSARPLLFTAPAESSLIVQLVRKEYDRTLSDSSSWKGKMYLL